MEMLLILIYISLNAWSICAVQVQRPNFIFILTDDQDVTLQSMESMPNTIKYIANQGVTFKNTFISTPICCPSRTETIAGRHYQNVINQGGPKCMHASAQFNVFNNTHSMFQIFERNGYLTASFGKVTNDQAQYWCNDDQPYEFNPYGETEIDVIDDLDSQPLLNGFSRIHCPCNYNNFYGTKYFDKFINGTTTLYDLPVEESTYQTSYIGNASIHWLKERMSDASAPFLMWIGPHAPHYPATPAAWYADRFSDYGAPRTPNYNQSDRNKHSFVATNPYITQNASLWIDQLYRDRLRSLLSVDDLVFDIFNALQQNPMQLNNTYILFTSDHGYHLGQYDVPCSKQQPYEETIRIPMYFMGPRVAKNSVSANVVGNIDILPTFLSLAEIEYDKEMYDGRTWTEGILDGDVKGDWRTTWLTQYESVGSYGFSHCSTWFPSSNGSVCPGKNRNPPEYNPEGKAWIVDDSKTNNWRAIRIINDTLNIMYAEFMSNWSEAAFDTPYFYEYYDINQDPFQLKNAYDTLDDDVQTELHLMLSKYGACSGTDCW